MANQVKVANSNGYKAIIGGLTLFGVLGGVFAMVSPMGQRIDFIERIVGGIEDNVLRHDNKPQHQGAAEDLAKMSERFKEVETQFKALRDISQLEGAKLERRISVLEEGGNPVHESRITEIERKLHLQESEGNPVHETRIEELERKMTLQENIGNPKHEERLKILEYIVYRKK